MIICKYKAIIARKISISFLQIVKNIVSISYNLIFSDLYMNMPLADFCRPIGT